MKENANIILTGIKPTGELHLGNYFGAITTILDLAKKNDDSMVYLFVADLHALTDRKITPEQLRTYTQHILTAYQVFCADIPNITIYRQSDFPQITMLAWLCTSLVTVPYLQRGHAFKDAVQKGKEDAVSAGTLLYPVLMASDILIMDADTVPVGADQAQHLEIARDIARKFNTMYAQQGTALREPQGMVIGEWKQVIGIDGRKMSKSYNNTIPIFDDMSVVEKRIASIVTDSTPAGGSIDPSNTVCKLLELFVSTDEYKIIQQRCREGKITYNDLKQTLVGAYKDYFEPFSRVYASTTIDNILEKNKNAIMEKVEAKIMMIKRAIGLSM